MRDLASQPTRFLLLALAVACNSTRTEILPASKVAAAPLDSSRTPDAIDWELALSEHTHGAAQLRRASSPAELAKVEFDALSELVKRRDYERAARETVALSLKYPSLTELHGDALEVLKGLIRAPEVPLEVKEAITDIVAPALKDRSELVFDWARFLRKAGVGKVRRFELVQRMANSCGIYAQCADALWSSLLEAAAELGADRFQTETKAFVARFGTESGPGREAQKAVLKALSGGDDVAAKKLKVLDGEDLSNARLVVAAFGEAAGALANADGANAARVLARLSSTTPAYATQEAWRGLLQSPTWSGLAAPERLPVLAVLVEQGPEGQALELAARSLRGLDSSRERARLLVRLTARSASDRERSCALADAAIKAAESTDDSRLQLEAFRAAATVARRLGATDRLPHYLNGFGKLAWDLAPDEARAALRETASHYPMVSEAAEAGWLLALLEGKLRVTPGPEPRLPRPDVRAEEPPALALPPAPAKSQATVSRAGGITLATQESKEDLLRHRLPRASTGQETAALTVDGDANTAWQPTQLPATLIVPLRQQASLAALRVGAAAPVYFQASVLDCEGQTLSRVERDWGFEDAYRTANYWPRPDETLKILPVAEACFVRLDVFASATGRARIHSVEAYPSAVQVRGIHLGEPVSVGNSRSIRVDFHVEEPRQKVSYDASGEWTRAYPKVRWGKFWERKTDPVKLKAGALAMTFFGSRASLVLDGEGEVGLQLDGGVETLLPPLRGEEGEHVVGSELAPGLHVLRMRAVASASPDQDASPAPDTRFVRMNVEGVSRARVAVRFGKSLEQWGPWSAPLAESGVVAVPDKVSGGPPVLAQAGAFFDAREVRGQEGATLRSLEVRPVPEAAQGARFERWPIEQRFDEALPQVAEALTRRAVVVTYPKAGTLAEYDAARRLAQRANVYLASDDVGLNLYGGTVLAVGTPLRSRYARQLLATEGLWNTPGFFARPEGVVGAMRDQEQKPYFFAVTGDTAAATVRAAERLLAKLPQAPANARPLRVFESSPLEELNPWQLETDRAPLSRLDLRMARGDRRSAVFAVSADSNRAKVGVHVSEPTSASGGKLPTPLVRPVGFYEWAPFFGDLRLPNALLDDAAFAMPASTTRAVWVTAVTPPEAVPGEYHAEVTIATEGQTERIPLVIRVESVSLSRQSKTGTFSFMYPPHWMHVGGPHYEAALRAIAANEAAHGVSYVGPPLLVDWAVAPYVSPTRVAQANPSTAPAELTWAGYTDASKPVEAGKALFVEFAAPVACYELLAATKASAGGPIVMAYWSGGTWVSLPAQPSRGAAMASALRFAAKAKVRFLRIAAQDKAAFSVDRVAAFHGAQKAPVQFDFSALERELQIYEEEYRRQGSTPRFVLQNARVLNLAAEEFSGIGNFNYGGLGSVFAPALRAYLAKTRRLERTLIKVDDEPKDIPQWVQRARNFRDAGLRTMTCHSGSKPELESAVGVMNPWCPNFSTDVFQSFFKVRQQRGDELWWYTFGPPNLRLTGKAADSLAFHWLTAKYEFDGEMTYAALQASKVSMPVPFRYENGESHRVLFLPDGRLLDTPRRELEGEGISDIKLIEFIREGASRLAQRRADSARAVTRELDEILNATVPDRYGYSLDRKVWELARTKLYDLGVRVGRDAP